MEYDAWKVIKKTLMQEYSVGGSEKVLRGPKCRGKERVPVGFKKEGISEGLQRAGRKAAAFSSECAFESLEPAESLVHEMDRRVVDAKGGRVPRAGCEFQVLQQLRLKRA